MEKKYSKLETFLLYEEQKMLSKTNPEKKKKPEKKKYYAYRKRKHYPRNESTYNQGQEEEFLMFLKYMEPAVNYVLDLNLPTDSSLEHYKRMHDNLVCLSLKKYFGKSLRRSMGIIRYVARKDFPDVKVPCFKTLDNYQNNPTVSFYVDRIIEATAQPLGVVETRFTTDGTGEATFNYSTWYCIKTGKQYQRRDHKIAKVTSTVLLNAAVAVEVSNSESPSLTSHVEVVSRSFTIQHWSADALYLTRENCNSVSAKGGEAHIRMKSNTVVNAKGSFEWKRTVALQKKKDEKELDELNLRQNAESTNSAKKRKFGSCTLAKNEWSQVNDIKLSWLDYDFSVLSRAYFEYDIVPKFLAHKFSRCFLKLNTYT